jgi:hypothetical protein
MGHSARHSATGTPAAAALSAPAWWQRCVPCRTYSVTLGSSESSDTTRTAWMPNTRGGSSSTCRKGTPGGFSHKTRSAGSIPLHAMLLQLSALLVALGASLPSFVIHVATYVGVAACSHFLRHSSCNAGGGCCCS